MPVYPVVQMRHAVPLLQVLQSVLTVVQEVQTLLLLKYPVMQELQVAPV
jgi:hypothetical protein